MITDPDGPDNEIPEPVSRMIEANKKRYLTLTAAVMMARIQPEDDNAEIEPKYDVDAISKPIPCVSLAICGYCCRPMSEKRLATWDGGKTSWGGRVETMGTVPVCVYAQESWGEGRVFWREKR
nr:hypothetical protein [Tanacetum cinerariifolium]